MIPDPSLSIEEGAIAVLGWQSCATKGSFTRAILDALCKEYHFDLSTPFQDYPKEIHDILIHGTNGHEVKVYYKGQRGEGVYDVAFEGLIKNVERRYRETGSESSKQEYETFMQITPCRACKGQRLKPEALAVPETDRRTGIKGNPCSAWLPGRCRTGLSDTGSCDRNTFGWGSTENPSCHTDRLRTGGRSLYPG